MRKKSTPKSFREIAQNLPAPRRGMPQFTIRGLEVMCEYMQMHNLKVIGFRGGVLVVDLPVEEKVEMEGE